MDALQLFLTAAFGFVPALAGAALALWVRDRQDHRRHLLRDPVMGIDSEGRVVAIVPFGRTQPPRPGWRAALLRESPAFAPVTAVDRGRDSWGRRLRIALLRTSPAFQPVAPPPSRFLGTPGPYQSQMAYDVVAAGLAWRGSFRVKGTPPGRGVGFSGARQPDPSESLEDLPLEGLPESQQSGPSQPDSSASTG